MIKSYDEMRKVDVRPYVKNRDGNDYLPWASCVELLHKNGAEKVYFSPIVNEYGSSLFMSSQSFEDKNGLANRCYEVRIHVVIDDLEFDYNYPVMNGNNPVKDNSMNQLRVSNAQARAFVKAVAIYTGLGFDLWLNDQDFVEEDSLSKHNMYSIKNLVQELYTSKLKKKMSVSDIARGVDMSEDQVKTTFTYFDQLDSFIRKLEKL